jgi:hypothetical protein
MSTATNIQALKDRQPPAGAPDIRVDMFSMQGFALAQRIAHAFATSDAVPAAFRRQNLKKVNGQEQWVDNPNAIGNCLVAIEVAQSVHMSVTMVMQNADVIEGKLRWNDRFVVACINSSGRFTPLRFDVRNLGRMKAAYKEKGEWDNNARRYKMIEREVEIENLQSIAWALPAGFNVPPNIRNLEEAKAAGLPVVEGVPVSIKLAVEEGWYAKPGSKWQTELKHKMLVMRSGRYFGDIHAPDIVMGMGNHADESNDYIDVTPTAQGTYAVDMDTLKNLTPELPNALPAQADRAPEDGAHDGHHVDSAPEQEPADPQGAESHGEPVAANQDAAPSQRSRRSGMVLE